jgi:hypothetical protein
MIKDITTKTPRTQRVIFQKDFFNLTHVFLAHLLFLI